VNQVCNKDLRVGKLRNSNRKLLSLRLALRNSLLQIGPIICVSRLLFLFSVAIDLTPDIIELALELPSQYAH